MSRLKPDETLLKYLQTRPRSLQKELGISDLGQPFERLMEKAAGGERDKTLQDVWPLGVGTAMHSLMENALRHHAKHNHGITEAKVSYYYKRPARKENSVAGHVDYVERDAKGNFIVYDWKFLGETLWEKIAVKNQVPAEYQCQLSYYARALERRSNWGECKHCYLGCFRKSTGEFKRVEVTILARPALDFIARQAIAAYDTMRKGKPLDSVLKDWVDPTAVIETAGTLEFHKFIIAVENYMIAKRKLADRTLEENAWRNNEQS